MNEGVILYGPPASGKDTITACLRAIDTQYVLFPRLKAGPGRTRSYRPTTTAALDKLRASGEIVWENARYGARYAVDREELLRQLRTNLPVLHLGQPEAIDAVRTATPDARWLIVALSCPWSEAERRIVARATGDTAARLQAWLETPALASADLRIDTASTDPSSAAEAIDGARKQRYTTG